MKANELMIGDWVQIVEPCKYAGAIGRIKTLIDHKDDENAYFKVFLQENTKHIGIEDICSEDIKPIPLVRIHLTKNGFKATNAEDTEFVYRDGYEIKVMIEEDLADAIFLSIEFAERNIWMEIKYVHELQQAMRLMGCEQEIRL